MNKKYKLFCLPFAGGSGYSMRGLSKYISSRIQIVSIDYPGRGKRISEPLLQNIHDVVKDTLTQIKSELHEPYAFYGHSMGTIVGYLLIDEIVKNNLPIPNHLFVSGRGGPQKYLGRKTHLLPPLEFKNELKRLGGVPEEILEDEEAMAFFEKILRADFAAVENYSYEHAPPFSVPITVMHGREENIRKEDADLWKDVTTENISVHKFNGGHFFIFDQLEGVAKIIDQALI